MRFVVYPFIAGNSIEDVEKNRDIGRFMLREMSDVLDWNDELDHRINLAIGIGMQGDLVYNLGRGMACQGKANHHQSKKCPQPFFYINMRH